MRPQRVLCRLKIRRSNPELGLRIRNLGRCLFIITMTLGASVTSHAQSFVEQLHERSRTVWRPNAPMCRDAEGFAFPGKLQEDGSCDDGDSVLFNALLCASREAVACEAVRRSQDRATSLPHAGRWWRSPRIALDPSLQVQNSFSHDHAIGVLLTTAVNAGISTDRTRFRRWMRWIEANAPCAIGSEPLCVRIWPRYCKDDTEGGCALRPGDLATVGRFVQILNEDLPQGPSGVMERLFSTMIPYAVPLNYANANLNAVGYSLHLVGVEILMWRSVGLTDPNILSAAANVLRDRQGDNAFFAYLAGRDPNDIAGIALRRCPTAPNAHALPRNEWMWERDDNAGPESDRRSMIWDCIFVSNLLGGAVQ